MKAMKLFLEMAMFVLYPVIVLVVVLFAIL